jgi:hypothetical protein
VECLSFGCALTWAFELLACLLKPSTSTGTLTGSLRAPCLCHALLDVEHRLYEHFGLFTLYEHYEHYEQVCGWVAKRTHCLLPPLP